MSANLVVTNLTQKFGGLTALNNVNMEVNFGEIVGVIGPNGAGKTTLFNVITGVYHATSGTVVLNGKQINGLKRYQITRLGFARTFQNIRLFKQMTVLDNVKMGMCCRSKCNIFDNILNTPRRRREDKAQEEKALGILERLNLLDYKYDSPASLPYGEQRRLEIARAMATDATILLLDEPAAGMNDQETAELLKTVSGLRDSGYTIILIEHDMKFVMNVCDRIYVLNHGELISTGTPDEVKNDPEVINAYLGKEEEK
ncbi:ABC transporter ATP-binding protein [Ruminococcus sp. YH-rum2234]|uniref:ABC transporter ATP-binding protein n=1 Tax=Fusibacillus kribbianus TaxID=3044208 RepID=A0AAP4B9X0_9FIRM|nr:ABC transporter ATP-binding protein [Ruminococcus sp. YH-rum2234]MDI9242399.1 ABC transporter ATP-binding protein [Ruminococcus sp. YH-rum2234]